jgi:hypothetical protein
MRTPPQQQRGLLSNLLGGLMNRGVDKGTLQNQLGIGSTNPNDMSPNDYARLASAEPNLNGSPPAVKVPNRRGKVARLSEPVRQKLNALLQNGTSYSQIIAWLNTQGYTGFNKVNLHNWRIGGFQDWLRDQAGSTDKNLNDA